MLESADTPQLLRDGARKFELQARGGAKGALRNIC